MVNYDLAPADVILPLLENVGKTIYAIVPRKSSAGGIITEDGRLLLFTDRDAAAAKRSQLDADYGGHSFAVVGLTLHDYFD